MRSATCAVLLAAGVLCTSAAAPVAGGSEARARAAVIPGAVAAAASTDSAGVHAVPDSAGAPSAAGSTGADTVIVIRGAARSVSPQTPPPRAGLPAPGELFPSGCEPNELRDRLTSATSAEVSRACGNISLPWAFRGRAGRRMALRDFGRHRQSTDWTHAVAGLLLQDATVDTAYRVPSIQSPCEARTGLPIYLVRFNGPDRPTFAVMRFDLGVAQFFDAELPLGMIEMGQHADSLWALIAQVLDDDPLLRSPRPVLATGDSAARLAGDPMWMDRAPDPIERVKPEYPDEARRLNAQGTVIVQVLIDTDGTVRDAVVLTGPPALRDPSLDALWQWRFRPDAMGTRSSAVWAIVPVKFTVR